MKKIEWLDAMKGIVIIVILDYIFSLLFSLFVSYFQKSKSFTKILNTYNTNINNYSHYRNIRFCLTIQYSLILSF